MLSRNACSIGFITGIAYFTGQLNVPVLGQQTRQTMVIQTRTKLKIVEEEFIHVWTDGSDNVIYLAHLAITTDLPSSPFLAWPVLKNMTAGAVNMLGENGPVILELRTPP